MRNQFSKKVLLGMDMILVILLVAIDQVTKGFATKYLKDGPALQVIDGVFEFHYLENQGAAFGMLQGQKLLFVILAVFILIAIAYVLVKAPNQKIYTKLHITLVLIASGAIGNLIDRIKYDYVVDFLYFSLINFPIFNIADIYVTLSSIYLVILLLFVYQESDLDFISFRTKKMP